MVGIIIFISTFTLDYVLMAILVGISFFTLFGHRIKTPRNVFITFIFIFAFLDLYCLPALYYFDVKMIVGNEKIAKILHVSGPIGMEEFFSPGWFNFFIWIIQAIIAQFIGSKVYEKFDLIKPSSKVNNDSNHKTLS